MNKAKVIIHCLDTSGVDYHRLVSPFRLLERDGLEVVWINTLEERKRFDAELTGKAEHGYLEGATHIICSRFWRYKGLEGIAYLIHQMNKRGIKVIIDNDDDWVIPKWNNAYYKYHIVGIGKAIEFSIKYADEVWVTQKELAAHVAKNLNKNVQVVPNGIDTTQRQWQGHSLPTEQMRFGYIAGSSHYRDLQWSKIDLSGEEGYVVDHEIKIDDKKEAEMLAQVQAEWHLPLVKEHIRLIRNATGNQSFAEIIKAKHKLPFLPVHEYANTYREIDVSLIPLRPGKFNRMKSNLKLLEAGFAKKAAIVSNVYPYTEGLKPNEMCISVGGTELRSMDWNKRIRNLSHEEAIEKAEALHEWVQPYELSRVNEVRKQLLEKDM